MEYYLVRTEGILFLSIPYIGVISAAEYISETGDMSKYYSSKSIIKLAGTEPRTYQSGKKNLTFGISHKGNVYLRETIEKIGYNLSNKRSRYFYDFSNRLKHDKGKAATVAHIAVGNKYIKVTWAMAKKRELFNPPTFKSEVKSYNPLDKIKYYHNDAKRKLEELLNKN